MKSTEKPTSSPEKRATNCILQRTSKRHIVFICVSIALDVPHCQLFVCDLSDPNFKLQLKNGLVRRITMYGHLTCPDKLCHVSDKRIGPISNPDISHITTNTTTPTTHTHAHTHAHTHSHTLSFSSISPRDFSLCLIQNESQQGCNVTECLQITELPLE